MEIKNGNGRDKNEKYVPRRMCFIFVKSNDESNLSFSFNFSLTSWNAFYCFKMQNGKWPIQKRKCQMVSTMKLKNGKLTFPCISVNPMEGPLNNCDPLVVGHVRDDRHCRCSLWIVQQCSSVIAGTSDQRHARYRSGDRKGALQTVQTYVKFAPPNMKRSICWMVRLPEAHSTSTVWGINTYP